MSKATEALKQYNKEHGYRFTKENAREMQLKGAEAKKRKNYERKTMQETARMLLGKAIKRGEMCSAEDIMSIAETEGKNIPVDEAIMIAQIQKAILGDTQSAIFVRDTLGEKPVDKIETGITIEEYVKEHGVKF